MDAPDRAEVVVITGASAGVGRATALAFARRLARNGFDSQQTLEAADPERPANLWNPLPGDHGAHGRFDDRAASSSPHFWFTTHRRWIFGFGLPVVASIAIGRKLR